MDAVRKSYILPPPNEHNEHSRLDIQHQVFRLSFDGDLRSPNLPPDFKPRSVLEVGCGSGSWATEYASENPDCKVVAFDINPPNIRGGPANLHLVPYPINAEEEDQWPVGQTFDYIHMRMLLVAVKDWRNVLRICWKHLNPGGWVEMSEAVFPYRAEDVAMTPENSSFLRFSDLFIKSCEQIGIDLTSSKHHCEKLVEQGFVEVSQTTHKWPANDKWPQDDKLKQIGAMTHDNFQQFVQAGPKLFNARLGMSVEEGTELVKNMIMEITADREKHYYVPVPTTVGQKPYSS